MVAGRSGRTNEGARAGTRVAQLIKGKRAVPQCVRSARDQQHTSAAEWYTRVKLRIRRPALSEFALTLNSSVAAKALED